MRLQAAGTFKPLPPPADKSSMLQTILRTAATVVATIVVFESGALASSPWQRPASAPAPADNHLTAARAEFGRALFLDKRL
jgi:hypothetical protein